MAKAMKTESVAIEVMKINLGVCDFCILGHTPLIHNRLAKGPAGELLNPSKKKTQNERATTLKHDPMGEFRRSAWTMVETDAPTVLAAPAVWFKKAMASVALDLGGASKAEIGRLVWVEGILLPLWGLPQMFMANTRSSDMNRTPDIRTRAIMPHWATKIRVRHMLPKIPRDTIVNLLAAAGVINGVGDWRNQKGGGTYGQFEIVEPGDARFAEIVKQGARKPQAAAMQTPAYHDDYTEDLYTGYVAECKRREMNPESAGKGKNGNGASVGASA